MSVFVRSLLAVVAGLVVGSVVNMGLIMLSGYIIPLPEGVDATNMESLKAGMELFGPQHFIMPWLAHALGTLAGAMTAATISHTKKKTCALIVGALFLIGGIMNVMMLPSPAWFAALDLLFAYIPMALLAFWIVTRSK